MKFLIASVLLTISLPVHAWFQVSANCSINKGFAKCATYNSGYSPLYCKMWARGRTSLGYWVNLNNQGILNSGNSMYVYINANNPYRDPIVYAVAGAQCRY